MARLAPEAISRKLRVYIIEKIFLLLCPSRVCAKGRSELIMFGRKKAMTFATNYPFRFLSLIFCNSFAKYEGCLIPYQGILVYLYDTMKI